MLIYIGFLFLKNYHYTVFLYWDQGKIMSMNVFCCFDFGMLETASYPWSSGADNIVAEQSLVLAF